MQHLKNKAHLSPVAISSKRNNIFSYLFKFKAYVLIFLIMLVSPVSAHMTSDENDIDENYYNNIESFLNKSNEKEIGLEFLRYFLREQEPFSKIRTENTLAFEAFRKGRELILEHNDDQNNIKAYEYFQEAVNKGDADSLTYVALCLFEGIGTKKDESKATKLLKIAAEKNVAQAQIISSITFMITVNSILADTYMKQAAAHGSLLAKSLIEGQNNLHNASSPNLSTSPTIKLFQDYQIQLAQQHAAISKDAESMNSSSATLLATYNDTKETAEFIKAQAIYWTFLSAQQGDIISHWILLKIKNILQEDELDVYEFCPPATEFIYTDEEKLNTLLSKQNNDKQLLLPIVLYYLKEKLNAEDDFQQILKIGVKIYPEAFKYSLARDLLKRSKFHYNPTKAIEILQELAKKNVILAMLDLAEIYYEGIHVKSNHEECKKWLKLAMKANSKPAERMYKEYFPTTTESLFTKFKKIIGN